MACTCVTCQTSYSGSCCPTCQPANSIFQGECSDPGTLSPGRFLQVLDYKFCERRLSSGSGFLVSNINGSGNAGFTWTTTPQVELIEYQATADQQFGNLIVMGSDFRWRYLQGPSTLGLYLQTDSNGMLFFGDPPEASVPDPLTVNNLNVAVAAEIADLTTSGTVTLNNTPSGTVVNLLGLNADSEVVTQSLAAGIAATMFYEEPTSPSGTAPNSAAASGSYLIIGNKLFDSGANLINVTTSQALTVAVAGKYDIFFESLHRIGNNSKVAVSLEINGVIVNTGNGRNDSAIDANTNTGFGWCPLCGNEVRSLAVGDVIKLQVSYAGTVTTFNVRLKALKFAD